METQHLSQEKKETTEEIKEPCWGLQGEAERVVWPRGLGRCTLRVPVCQMNYDSRGVEKALWLYSNTRCRLGLQTLTGRVAQKPEGR